MLTFILLVIIAILGWKQFKNNIIEFKDKVIVRFNQAVEQDKNKPSNSLHSRMKAMEEELEKLRKKEGEK